MVSGPLPPADQEAAKALSHCEDVPRGGGRSSGREASGREASGRKARKKSGDLHPIGPERLRELREAIRNGTYPTEQNAREGLANMFLGHRRRPRASDADD